jgi:glycogen operon protein
VNFIAAHDGLTLADVVSYAGKHNQANGEDNRDGRDDEPAANFGVEGPTDDIAILRTRSRVQRAMLATMLLAQGTPMLNAGDEIGNSQHGNNNAYCQDNPTGWIDWQHADNGLLAFAQRVLALRREEPALRHDRWFQHAPCAPGELSLAWLTPAGHEMQVHDWHDAGRHAFACRIDTSPDEANLAQSGGSHLLIAFNPEADEQAFDLAPGDWQVVLDSSDELNPGHLPSQPPLRVAAHALVVLRSGSR